jgi:succinyl-diaminopimelate desuccinylase
VTITVAAGRLGYHDAPMPPALDQAIRAAADADHQSVIDLARRLVQRPSRAGIDSYEPVLGLVEGWLQARGLRPWRLRDDEGNPVGLACDVEGAQPGPCYVLDACVDTAPFGEEQAWRHPPASGVIVDGWLFGRGSADCKTAVAIFAHLAVRLRQQAATLAGCATLLFDADEHTGGFAGARRFFTQQPARDIAGVMIGYPGSEQVVVGGRGFLRAELVVRGSAAHSGGKATTSGNAVEKAALLVTALSRQQLPSGPDEAFPLPPKLTVATIQGGEGYTIVPDACTVAVDVRLTPTFDQTVAAQLVEQVARAVDRRWPTTHPTGIRFEESWPAYRLAPDSRLGMALTRAASHITGQPVGTKIAGPSNIGNYLATLGIEATAGFGVNYRNLHATDECIELATIPLVQATYHKAVSELLATPAVTTTPRR